MNQVERMQVELSALQGAVKDLQTFLEPYRVRYSDVQEAHQAARDAGIDVGSLAEKDNGVRNGLRHERARVLKSIIQLLSRKGWSAERIARAIDCSGRTVQRHLAKVAGPLGPCRDKSGNADTTQP